jgi:hypothetical protein
VTRFNLPARRTLFFFFFFFFLPCVSRAADAGRRFDFLLLVGLFITPSHACVREKNNSRGWWARTARVLAWRVGSGRAAARASGAAPPQRRPQLVGVAVAVDR